jgi:hypothetical protein
MSTLRPKNWAEFQHYKDRSPAWIKLHRGILDDFDYSCLPLASKALAPLLWLLASEHKDGDFSDDPERIAHRIRWTVSDVIAGLKPLLDKGFFEPASGVLASCYQDACLEERRGEDIKREKNTVQRTAARFPDFWEAYPNKKGKQDAEKRWRRDGLDGMADEIIAHVRLMAEVDDGWRRGYVPMGSTYLNQARWTDVPQAPPQTNGHAQITVPVQHKTVKQALAPTEDKLTAQLRWLRNQVERGVMTESEFNAEAEKARERMG